MRTLSRIAGLAIVALAVTGCKKDSTSGGTTQFLTLTPTASAIAADGFSTTSIHVAGASTSPITVTTTKGTFSQSNTATVVIAGFAGDVTLVSCDKANTPNCLGAASIHAVDGAGNEGYTTVTFTVDEICNNGKDDNQNGLVDCADPQCPTGVACGPNGLVCATNKTCTGCSGGEAHETSCGDGRDNDCDGKIDCADEDCDGKSCKLTVAGGSIVGTCQSGACVCSGTEQHETSCGDGIDNDCDGLIDCADPDCQGKVCDANTGKVCGVNPVGCNVCPSGQTTELASQCADGKDNDCDGKTDCDDSDCIGKACNAFGKVCNSSGICACPSGKVVEQNCSDGVDDDCDGLVDCADTDCDGQACGGTPGSVCENSKCVDVTTKYAIAVTPVKTRLPAVAAATTPVALEVQFDGKPAVAATLDITVTPGTLGNADVTSVVTNGDGVASFNFVASGQIGTATITATVRTIGAKGTAAVEMPALGQIDLASQQYQVLGVKYSGFQESSIMSVQLLDTHQQPYPAGLPVLFRHLTLGGSSLSLPALPDVSGVCQLPWCVAYQGVTDAAGVAQVTLYSGTVAGTVPIKVFAQAGSDPQRTFDLPSIAIIGARPSGDHLSIVCDPQNVPALARTTCSTSLIDAPFTCVAVVKDRFNNIVGRATTVTFMSEAGAVGQPATTPAYDPTKDPLSQSDLGTALEIFNTLGDKLPKDVPPHQGMANPYGANLAPGDPRYEYSFSYDDLACLPTIHNPRDGIVTVIASTPGEEAFFDSNGNGVYDPGEPFVDLGEPFVDYNDNDIRDADEPFIDSNGNGIYDGPNGKWDADTKIWTQTRIVYTTLPQVFADAAGDHFTRWIQPTDVSKLPGPTPPTSSATATATAATSLYLAAIDGNFNPLAKGTSYSVQIRGDTWQAYNGYLGQSSLNDVSGFSFVYWPCDASDTTKCANSCEFASSPPPARCLMRSVLRGYSYGYVTRAQFRSPDGTTISSTSWYKWEVDLLGTSVQLPMYVTYGP